MCCANMCERGITQQVSAGAAERRIGHHWHDMLLAPWQQVTFDTTIAEIIKNLIGRAAIAVWNTEEILHVTDSEVGHAQA